MNMSYMMEREINSQIEVIGNLFKRFFVNYCVLADIPQSIKKINIIASGSSYNAGLFGKYFFENISKVPTNVQFASECLMSDVIIFEKNALYVFLSQSGSSYDTLTVMQKIKEAGACALAITNNNESQMHNLADFAFYLDAGKEQAIAATKTFSATVVMLWLLALKIAQNKKYDVSSEIKNANSIEVSLKEMFDNIQNLDMAAKLISKQKSFSIAGAGANYPLACETALKIKETSYINTCAYPMGEYIHGHFAVLNKQKVFLTFINQYSDSNERKLLSKITSTYKTKTIVVSDEYDDYDCSILVKIPKHSTRIMTILNSIIAIQLLAFKTAICLKRNVDNPKGLDKIVSSGHA